MTTPLTPRPLPGISYPDLGWQLAGYLLVCLLLGGGAGALWAFLAHRPGYLVLEDLSAVLNERGMAAVFAADAWYAALMLLLGMTIGLISWIAFRRLGGWVNAIALVGSLLAALVAWQGGLLIGQQGFDERLTNAAAGELVAIDLKLRSYAALLVAPFAAAAPIMLAAAFWPEDPSAEIVSTESSH